MSSLRSVVHVAPLLAMTMFSVKGPRAMLGALSPFTSSQKNYRGFAPYINVFITFITFYKPTAFLRIS